MSTPAAKRRRMEVAAKTLSQPFRSPFKTPCKTPVTASETQGLTQIIEGNDVSMINISPTGISILSPQGTGSTSKAAGPHCTSEEYKKPFLSPASGSNWRGDFQDPEIAALLRAQRALEKQLSDARQELETAKQAQKIETGSKLKSPEDQIDPELVELIRKWKTASRQAAEELFGLARDRVNRYGLQYLSPVLNALSYRW